MMFQIDSETIALLSLVGGFFLLAYAVKLVLFLRWFCEEKRRVNNEFHRAAADEKAYWRWRRQRLWLSLLPFVKY